MYNFYVSSEQKHLLRLYLNIFPGVFLVEPKKMCYDGLIY